MPRKNTNARPATTLKPVSSRASTAWAALAVMLVGNEERRPVTSQAPLCSTTCVKHEGATGDHRTRR
jgi:hypothetical protein